MEESVKEVPISDCIWRIQRRTSWAARLGEEGEGLAKGEKEGGGGGERITRVKVLRDLAGRRCSLGMDHLTHCQRDV